MTRDNIRENEAGANTLAERLTQMGHIATAAGHPDLARRCYSANAKARALADELHKLASYQENVNA